MRRVRTLWSILSYFIILDFDIQIDNKEPISYADIISERNELEYTQEELNQLFYPHLSRMKHQGEGVLTGTEYLVCKQIIRDHDEFAGRRGCRMNACQATEGGFMVWFTIPIK